VVTLYDLIPYLNQQAYLTDPYIRRWYTRRLQHLRNADLLLAISESSRQEALNALDICPEQVVNISSAIDGHFQPTALDKEKIESVRQCYGLRGEFLMYTGGVDYRKNVEGLIEAYAQLEPALRQQFQLVIVCKIRESDRSRLESLGKHCGLSPGQLVFTGFVNEDHLVALYTMAHLFVFPSLHEGFGLPVLEAMACGTPTIGANRSSIPEVINNPEALFDPADKHGMVVAIRRGLIDNEYRRRLSEQGLAQAPRFSWQASAKAALEAIEARVAGRVTRQAGSAVAYPGRPKLAYLSPLPPQRSGIADYSARILPALARYYDIEIISDESEISDELKAYFPVRSTQWFLANAKSYQRVLYHMGNSHFHIPMIALLNSAPGVVVLHDFYLSGMLNHAQSFGLDDTALSLSMVRSHGYRALNILSGTGIDEAARCYPANRWVLDGAIGVLVHSRYSLAQCEKFYGPVYQQRLSHIPFPCPTPPAVERVEARGRWGLKGDDFIVCCFGFLAASKLNHLLIQAWTESDLASASGVKLVFVGGHTAEGYGQRIDRQVSAARNISITGYVTGSIYEDWLAAADVGVQLRSQSRGETSAALFDCLGHGLPLIYNAHGTASELPDEVGVRLDDEPTVGSISDALTSLWRNADLRRLLGEVGREFVLRSHNPLLVARRYFEAIEQHYQESSIAAESIHVDSLGEAIAQEAFARWTAPEVYGVSRAVVLNRSPRTPPRLLLDITGSDIKHLASALSVLIDALPAPWQLECVRRGNGGWTTARDQVPGLIGVPDEYLVPHRNDCWIAVVTDNTIPFHDTPALYLAKSARLDLAHVEKASVTGLISWILDQGERPSWLQGMV
jgi:glycosyltransferase involved in cell wall biosynthesis